MLVCVPCIVSAVCVWCSSWCPALLYCHWSKICPHCCFVRFICSIFTPCAHTLCLFSHVICAFWLFAIPEASSNDRRRAVAVGARYLQKQAPVKSKISICPQLFFLLPLYGLLWHSAMNNTALGALLRLLQCWCNLASSSMQSSPCSGVWGRGRASVL